jgi:diguanylate cyclase (GGDEF)-like protein
VASLVSTAVSKLAAGRLHTADVVRAWRALWSMPRARLYPVLGALLTFGAMFAWAAADQRYLPGTYGAMALSTVIAFAVLGWLLGRSFDRMRTLSITDPLTGLYNRRYFGQRTAAEVRRGQRHGHATCVLCLDVDRLKAINDRFGHKAGDRAIVAVARILLDNVRAGDAVARMGGDEFAVLLHEASATQAMALAGRIQRQLASRRDALIGALAVSIGITELDAGTHEGWEDVLAVADAALYRAKSAGGGQFVMVAAARQP